MGGQRHAPAALYPRERPGTHCMGGWEGPSIPVSRIPGEVCDRFAKQIRVGSVTSRTTQSRHDSTGLRLIPQVKRAHAWTRFSLPGRGFCSGYPSHLRTEEKCYPKWNSKSSEMLGRGH